MNESIQEATMWKEVADASDLVHRQNDRIQKAIKNVLGEGFLNDLKVIGEAWNLSGGFFPYNDEIVRSKVGEYHNFKDDDTGKSLKYIKGFYVNEYESGGMEGDSFSGYVYIKLKKGRYLKTHYSL